MISIGLPGCVTSHLTSYLAVVNGNDAIGLLGWVVIVCHFDCIGGGRDPFLLGLLVNLEDVGKSGIHSPLPECPVELITDSSLATVILTHPILSSCFNEEAAVDKNAEKALASM